MKTTAAKTILTLLLTGMTLTAGTVLAHDNAPVWKPQPWGYGAGPDKGRGYDRHDDDRYHRHDRYPDGRKHGDVSSTHRFDERQERQMDRIRDGIRDGELTRFEADRLMREQMAIREMERRFMADGYLNQWERRHLEDALDNASQNIRRQTRDDDARFNRYWR